MNLVTFKAPIWPVKCKHTVASDKLRVLLSSMTTLLRAQIPQDGETSGNTWCVTSVLIRWLMIRKYSFREHTFLFLDTDAARISGCLYNLIWNNKYMSIDSKVRIYKTNVRPVLTYASETRAETAYTQQLFRTTETKTIRAIHGKTLRDKIRSDHLRHLSINKWTEARRREWDAHVVRMEDNRLAQIARDSRPQGVRNRGRPKKRWKESLIKTPHLNLWKNRR
jgi:hypothetical protein